MTAHAQRVGMRSLLLINKIEYIRGLCYNYKLTVYRGHVFALHVNINVRNILRVKSIRNRFIALAFTRWQAKTRYIYIIISITIYKL